jgi:two-component system sporulation sensor kinase A
VAFEVFPFLKQIGEDAYFQGALRGETATTQERPYRTPAGRNGFFEAYYMPIKNSRGEILGGQAIVRDVSERRRVSEALRQSESNLRAVFNNTFQNIVLVDREGRIKAFNNNALLNNRQWMGKDLEPGRSITDFVSEGNQALFRTRFQKALQGEVVHHEQRYNKGGEEQWLEISYNPVFGDEGEIEGVCLIATNVIERKMAEEALQKSEADLRAIFESGNQSIIFVDRQGKILDFNRQAREALRATRNQELEKGRLIDDFVELEYVDAFRERFQKVLAGIPVRVERTVQSADGKPHWFEFSYNPVLDREGKVQGACLVITSIDERKKAEEIVRESEEKFRRVFEDAAMPMAMVSDFHLLKVNRAFLELLGYEEKEVLGRHIMEITYPDDRPSTDKISRSVHDGQRDRFETEKRYLRKDGEGVWAHTTGSVIRDSQGKPLYSLVLIENIQERKVAQEALRQSESDLRAVFNNVDQAVVLLTSEGRVQSFNSRAAESFRLATGKELVRGSFFRDYIRSSDMVLYESSFKNALEGQRVLRERAYRTPDGVEHWYEFGYYPVPAADGRVAGICFVSQRIDERKKAEEDLRRSEAELRAVFNSGSQVTVLIRPDGTIQDFNQFALMMAQRVQGKTLAKGMLFVETLPQGASETQFHESFQTAMAGKETRAERAIRDSQGQERWVEVRYQPALNPVGGVEAVCFSLSFIDERKRAEEALRESQERFERFALVTHEGILMHENPKVVDANPALAAMLGYKTEEMIGRSGFDFLAPESHPTARKHMVEGSSQPYEALALRKDGTTFPVELRGRNFHFKGRELRVMSVRDMTWNKAAERILTESEERYRRLVELSPDAVVVHSGGEILYVNPAGLALFGGEGKDLREVKLTDFLHPDTREKALERIVRIQETGQPTEWMEQRLVRLDGEEIFGETKGTPFLFKGVPAVLTIVRDMTERRRSQQTLLRYERLAAVGKVIAAIAHEVRNPLAVLTGMIQLMNAKMEGRKEYSQELKTMLSQAERLRFFMNDILDYSKELEIRKEPVVIEDLLDESLAAAQAQAGAQADKVDLEMPRRAKWITLSADQARLQQVLVNLLTNAYQAVGEKGRIKLGVKQSKAETRLIIEDDGPGIPDADLNHLFEPFFTTKKGGSGLGLSISQKIAAAHGGKIEVERLKPHGTRFTVVLPTGT